MTTETNVCVINLLNNGTISAFAGAGFAYLLVWFTDRRRDRKKIAYICGEVQHCLFHAKSKLDSVRRSYKEVTDNNSIAPGRMLHFNIDMLQRLLGEALGTISMDQRRAIDAISFTMLECDHLLDDLYNIANRFKQPLPQADQISLPTLLINAHRDAIIALKRLVQISEWYIEQEYQKILGHQYRRSEYIEWQE